MFCHETWSFCNSNIGYMDKSVANFTWLITIRLLLTVSSSLLAAYTPNIYSTFLCRIGVSYKPTGISSSPCNIAPGPSSLFQCHLCSYSVVVKPQDIPNFLLKLLFLLYALVLPLIFTSQSTWKHFKRFLRFYNVTWLHFCFGKATVFIYSHMRNVVRETEKGHFLCSQSSAKDSVNWV